MFLCGTLYTPSLTALTAHEEQEALTPYRQAGIAYVLPLQEMKKATAHEIPEIVLLEHGTIRDLCCVFAKGPEPLELSNKMAEAAVSKTISGTVSWGWVDLLRNPPVSF